MKSLNDAFYDMTTILSSGYYSLKLWMTALLAFIFMIDLLFMAVKFGLGMKDPKEWLNKLLNYGIWTVAVTIFPDLMRFIQNIFTSMGMAAGKLEFLDKLYLRQFYLFNPLKSGSVDNLSPGAILNLGMIHAAPLYEASKLAPHQSIATGFFFLICWFLMIISYVIMTVQYMMTYLEFAVLMGIGGIFMPFGIMQETRFLSEKFLGAAVGHGIKMLILNFIIIISFPVLRSISVTMEGGTPAVDAIIISLTMSFLLMIMALTIPQLAVGILSGTPALNDGHLANTMRTVISATRTAGSILAPLARGALQGGVFATGGIAKAVGAGNRAAADYGGFLNSASKAIGGKGGPVDKDGLMASWFTAAGGSLASSLRSSTVSGAAGAFNRLLWGHDAKHMPQLHNEGSLQKIGRAGNYIQSRFNEGKGGNYNNHIMQNGNTGGNNSQSNKKSTLAENVMGAFSGSGDNSQQTAPGLEFNFKGDKENV